VNDFVYMNVVVTAAMSAAAMTVSKSFGDFVSNYL
jgi:hypothetical protein